MNVVSVELISDPGYAGKLHEILLEAFLPYKEYYTPDAFNRTVISADEFHERIISPHYSVYGSYLNNILAGTVTSKKTDQGDLYLMTMAVQPVFSGNGLAKSLLHLIEADARRSHIKTLYLETYQPLESAIQLYEREGFHRTGRKRNYSGIEVFEMKKEVKD